MQTTDGFKCAFSSANVLLIVNFPLKSGVVEGPGEAVEVGLFLETPGEAVTGVGARGEWQGGLWCQRMFPLGAHVGEMQSLTQCKYIQFKQCTTNSLFPDLTH